MKMPDWLKRKPKGEAGEAGEPPIDNTSWVNTLAGLDFGDYSLEDEDTEMHDALRTIVVGGFWLTYAFVLLLLGARNWNLQVYGLAGSLVLFGYVGAIALFVNSILLPLALHFWGFQRGHRLAIQFAWGVDILILIFNARMDFRLIQMLEHAGKLTDFDTWYLNNVVPVTPVIIAVQIGLLLLLDPSTASMQGRKSIKADLIGRVQRQMKSWTKSPAFNQVVVEAAKPHIVTMVKNALGLGAAGSLENMLGTGKPSDTGTLPGTGNSGTGTPSPNVNPPALPVPTGPTLEELVESILAKSGAGTGTRIGIDPALEARLNAALTKIENTANVGISLDPAIIREEIWRALGDLTARGADLPTLPPADEGFDPN